MTRYLIDSTINIYIWSFYFVLFHCIYSFLIFCISNAISSPNLSLTPYLSPDLLQFIHNPGSVPEIKTWGFQGWSYLSNAWLTDWNENHQEIINTTREKRACRPYSPSSILYCPEVHWSLSSETVLVGCCLIWRPVGQNHIYWSKTRPHDSLLVFCRRSFCISVAFIG